MFFTPRHVLIAPFACLLIALCSSSRAAAQQTWIVDQNNGPGTHFTTISAGVAAAAPDDKVFVRAGLYVEDVLITKGITLVGWNATTYPMSVPANPYAAAIQGTLGIVDVDNFQTLVISGFSVVPNGPPGINVGILNSRGPIVLDRMVIEDGALWIYGGEDVILQDVRIRAAQAGPTAAPQPGITVVGSWVQATDVDVVGGHVGVDPDLWPEGGAALEVYYPSIVALARPRLMGGSGGGPWISTGSTPAGGPAVRLVGGIVSIVDDQTNLNYLVGGQGGARGAASSPSIMSGHGGNSIEIFGGTLVNKMPMPLTPGLAGANLAGGPTGASGQPIVTASGGQYIPIADIPALFRISGSTLANGSLTFTFQSAAPGLLCGLGACDDFDLTILSLTPSVQFSAGKPSAVQFLDLGTSNAQSLLEFSVALPGSLGAQAGRSGMCQGADVVNNVAFLSNPSVIVLGY
jgi:hypothetical protein